MYCFVYVRPAWRSRGQSSSCPPRFLPYSVALPAAPYQPNRDTMAPKRGETAQQKAQRLMKAGRKLRLKADSVTVCQCLRDREDLISFFRDELVGRGELAIDGEGNLAPCVKGRASFPCDARRRCGRISASGCDPVA